MRDKNKILADMVLDILNDRNVRKSDAIEALRTGALGTGLRLETHDLKTGTTVFEFYNKDKLIAAVAAEWRPVPPQAAAGKKVGQQISDLITVALDNHFPR